MNIDRDLADSIFEATVEFVKEYEEEFDELLPLWIEKRDFSGLARVLVWNDALNCLKAGSIAYRYKNDSDQAFAFWSQSTRAMTALERAVAKRSALSDGGDPPDRAKVIPAGFLYELVTCLLFVGRRGDLTRIAGYMDLPFFSRSPGPNSQPDPAAAEIDLLLAAWRNDRGNAETALSLVSKLHMKNKASLVYADLWKAVLARDKESLQALLPTLRDAYRAAPARKSPERYGGYKDYNTIMIDAYGTSILKIAYDAGIRWNYPDELCSELWPCQLVERWE